MPHGRLKDFAGLSGKARIQRLPRAEDVLVEQPTGSGKTVQIVTLVAMHLGKRFTHPVISAPQEQIEQGFVKRDYSVVAFPERPGVAVPSIQVPKHTKRLYRIAISGKLLA